VATSTSLNLRAALKTAVTRSGMDAPARAVSGLTPSAKALYVAAASQAQPAGVILYIVPSDGDPRGDVCGRLVFHRRTRGARAGCRRAGGPAVSVARGRSVPWPRAAHWRDVGAGAGAVRGRPWNRARRDCLGGRDALTRDDGGAPAVRIAQPQTRARHLTGRSGRVARDAGFSRQDPADEPGEFAIRGGIADVFPAGEMHPVRLEFIGDTIETLRTYDPSTQRSIAPIDQISIVPLRDCPSGQPRRHHLRLSVARERVRDHRLRARPRSRSMSPSSSRRFSRATRTRSDPSTPAGEPSPGLPLAAGLILPVPHRRHLPRTEPLRVRPSFS